MKRGSQRFLALETSSARLSLAIGDERRVIGVWAGAQNWRHAESLLAGIDAILKKGRWPLKTLTGIAVSIGPGSFTGIRIGLAAARALGQFLTIPVVGVSSLEILAYGSESLVSAPVIDALRGQVFAGLYARIGSQGWKRLQPDALWTADAWAETNRLWRKKHAGLTLIEAGEASGCYPRAEHLLTLAAPRLCKATPEAYKRILPLYLREASAVERLRA
jgi:tRNA threonylcarbamoyl adenosine modification protein YeaZ